MNKGLDNVGKRLGEIFIYPEAGNPYSQKKHRRFLREFAAHPEAETLRVRYRVITSILIFGPMISAIPLTRHLSPELSANWFSWIMIFCMLTAALAPNLDHSFVREVMKRRARLEARSRPCFAEKLLWFFLPSETADEAIEHLNAKFEDRKARYGTGYARRWYCWNVIRALAPNFDTFMDRALKWGILVWIRELILKNW